MAKSKDSADEAPRRPYTVPRLKRIGAVRELTQNRKMSGLMDGGSNNSRTG